MRIGFFTDGYLPQINGVATSVEELQESLLEINHKVYVVAPEYPKYKDKNKNVLRLKSFKLFKNPELRVSYIFPNKIFRNVFQADFDIIHGFSGGSVPSLGFTLAKLKRKPYVFTYNTRWNEYTHYVLGGKLLSPKAAEKIAAMYCNVCTHIIAPADYVKDELIRFGVKKPITVIPNGVNTKRFKPENKDYLKNLLSLPKDSKIILYVGRLAKEKSIDFLINSFSQISNKNYYLVLVGEGPERENIEALINSLNLSQKVILLGSIEHNDLSKIYNGSDVLAFASTTETQGMVILEAMACELPVVAVVDKVFEQFVENGQDSFLVEKDEKIFAEKLKEVLEDEDLRLKIAKNARIKAKQFSLEEIAKKFDTLYRSL